VVIRLMIGYDGHMREEPYVLVIGATNIDVCGKSHSRVVLKDSNPGTVSLSTGGVGHNIALNLALMGMPVRYITALGDDEHGRMVLDEGRRAGIEYVLPPFPGLRTGTYVYVSDADGDMVVAVNDMEVTASLTVEMLEPYANMMGQAALVVTEANLPATTLAFIADHSSRLAADPVSTIKMGRLAGLWNRLFLFKPNKLEAEMLTGVTISDERSLQKACRTMVDWGIGNVVVSLGSDGACLMNKQRYLHYPVAKTDKMVNATGAGDAFVAGFCFGIMRRNNDAFALRCALAASALTIESEAAVNAQINGEAVMQRAGVCNESVS